MQFRVNVSLKPGLLNVFHPIPITKTRTMSFTVRLRPINGKAAMPVQKGRKKSHDLDAAVYCLFWLMFMVLVLLL